MANDFSGDSNIYAHWRFEPGGLTTDSKSTNHLTAYNSPAAETSDYMEGTGCARLNMRQTQYFGITDANLVSGFPLKSNDTTKTMSLSAWFKFESFQNQSYQDIISKWSSTQSRQCFLLRMYSFVSLQRLYFYWKYNNTTGNYALDTGATVDVGKWYWVGIRIDGVNRWLRIYLFDRETKTMTYYNTQPGTALYMGAADLCFGAQEDSTTYAFHGLIDEVVVSNYYTNSFDKLQLMREQRYSGTGTGLIVTNDYSGDSRVKAHWRFEPAGLTTDSISTNHLTASASSPTAASSYHEGSGAADFEDSNSQCFYRLDSDLAAGFPLKSGDTKKQFSVCFWMNLETLPGSGNWDCIISKYDSTAGKRSFWAGMYYNRFTVLWGYSSGASQYQYDYLYGAAYWGVGQWYHVGITIDGVAKILYVKIWDEVLQKVVANTLSKPASELYINDVPLMIGASSNVWPTVTNYFDGIIDDVVVFDRVLTSGEIDAIREGRFASTHQALQVQRVGAQVAYRSANHRNIFCVRPERGCNTNTGASWDQALTSWKVPFSTDDIVLYEKCEESSQSGTATATNNSRTVNTTADLTSACPQHTVIRFDADDDIHLVRSVTSNTISLYRPYRGTTGSGKTVKKLARYRATAETAMTPGWGSARPGQTVEIRGGANVSTSQIDGFTVFDLYTGSAGLDSPFTFSNLSNFKLSRMGMYGGQYPFNFSSCRNVHLERCYNFRGYFIYSQFNFSSGCTDFVLDRVFAEALTHSSDYSHFTFSACGRFTFFDCESWHGETGNYSLNFSGFSADFTFTRFRQGHALAGIKPDYIRNITFIDSEFGADTGNSTGDIYFVVNPCSYVDLAFINSKFYSTNLFNTSSTYFSYGTVAFEKFNQVDTDHRVYHLSGIYIPQRVATADHRALVSADYSTYRTAAPASKIAFTAGCRFPIPQTFQVPCDANTYRTISVYMRKNSAYGSLAAPGNYLPFMKLRYPTLIAGVTTFTETTATMPDTIDTWSLVSAGITPCSTGAIEVEMSFWTVNPGAIVWYDDFSVA